MKVLHILETSIPDLAGYTIRANAIIRNQRSLGLDPVVITSPLFPSPDSTVAVEELEGVRYYRTNAIRSPAKAGSRLASYATRIAMLSRYRSAVLKVAEKENVEVLHAHSSYSNAYAALPAARRLGLPLLYEVRTLWGESAVVEDGLRPDSLKHRLVWRLELGAMRRADLVVPISQGIRDALVERGITPAKLEVVPNGVDCAQFVPAPRDEDLARSVGLSGHFVIGFVGSIRRLEGLSTLLDAYAICRSRRRKIALVIVGDGPDKRALEEKARQMGVAGIHFTGRVPHAEVASWYSVIDVVVYPRIRAVINERVTPLKPLEVMALGKVCLGSDVGGLRELIRQGETGLIFRSEDPVDLAGQLSVLMDNPAKMTELGQAALQYVRREREWKVIVSRYAELYEYLTNRKRNHSCRLVPE